MLQQILNTRIVLLSDTTANWENNKDGVLLMGEVAIEFTPEEKVKIKIGDGITAWKDLSYFGGESVILGDDKSIQLKNGTLKIFGIESAQIGQTPIIGEDGSIKWYTPVSAENIDTLTKSINDLEYTLGDVSVQIDGVKSNLAELITNIDNIYTKDEVDFLLSNIKPQGKINEISVGGTLLNIVDGKVDIPIGNDTVLGAVRSSSEIIISDDGAMFINKMNVEKIYQPDDVSIVMYSGGSASK